jgi:hypothetical protein
MVTRPTVCGMVLAMRAARVPPPLYPTRRTLRKRRAAAYRLAAATRLATTSGEYRREVHRAGEQTDRPCSAK